ncbi:serine hydrolase domain-containing protein [Maricurvus nonylphenolicus]|uniref:serine hydrolase domain-containing protein n=1 Tax=Maricurvus nonylphenolicus TaxID=1008307 RepID=UPI0036F3D359
MNKKSLMLSALLIILLAIAAAGFKYGHIVERILFAASNDKATIASNLRLTDTKYNHHVVGKSSQPTPLPTAPSTNLQDKLWPTSFESQGETLVSDDFLQQAQVTGLIVVKDGHMIFEDYWHGLSQSQRQFAFSVAKSMTSVIMGFAIADGLIDDVNDPVIKYLPQFKGSAWDNATIANTLEMSSGVDFFEDYSRTDTDMSRFQKAFAFDQPIEPFMLALTSKAKPGTYQGYNSMEAQMAGMVIRSVLGERSLTDYMHEKLWQPLGAEDDATWVTDVTGMELSIGGLSMSLRDLAKVGQLMLQRGEWQGKQLLPEAWVMASTTPLKPYQLPGRDNPLSAKPFGYGYLWWTPVEPNGREFYASGIHGQYLFVNEEKNLVIALYSANYQFTDDPDGWKEKYENFFQAIASSMEE